MAIAILLTVLFFLATIAAGFFSAYSDRADHPGLAVFSGIFCFLLAIVFIVFGVCTALYGTAVYEAKIINSTFQTSYTADDMFWAGSTVKEIVKQYMQSDLQRFQVQFPELEKILR